MAAHGKGPVVVPQSIAQAADDQKRIAQLLREIQNTESTCNAEVSERMKQAADEVAEREQEIKRLARGIYAFAEEHRKELTAGGTRKTVPLPHSGFLLWYSTPAAVDVKNAEEVLRYLKKKKLHRFIRIKEEVDRESMLREKKVASAIPGVFIRSGQKFALRPLGTKSRVECNVATKRWKIASAA